MLKRIIASIMVLFLCFGILFSYNVPVAKAAGNTYFVATTGNDTSGHGSFNNPWRTIQKAASIMTAGDTCMIRGGVYRETVTPVNSGTANGKMIFRNYNNEVVTISGADLITGWSKDNSVQGAVYKAAMPWTLGTGNQVFVNGKMMDEARWPNNTGTLLTPTLATAQGGSNITLSDNNLSNTEGFYNGAKIWLLGGSEWVAYYHDVTAYNAATKTLTFTSSGAPNANYDAKAGNGYYLFGLKNLLDAENEWWYDSAAQMLHLWAPAGVDPSNIIVEAKRRNDGFDLRGKSYITIEGINLFSTQINTDDNTNNTLIKGIKAEYVSHDFYKVRPDTNSGNIGIIINGTNNELNSCEFAYSSAGVLWILGSNNKVYNCYIRDGNYGATIYGVLALSGSNLHAAYNTVKNAGRDCVTIKDIKSSIIEYNDVSNAGLLTKDGGIVYGVFTDGMGTEIRYNKLHDISCYLGSGIYFDNSTSNFIVHHNVIWNTVADAIKFNLPGNFLLAFNNTCVNDGSSGRNGNYNLFGSRYYNNIFTGYPAQTNQTLGLGWGNNIVKGNDPGFVDPTNKDFRLKESSIAIDTGRLIAGINDSYNGISPDIGAYEFGAEDFEVGHDFVNPPDIPLFQYTNNPYKNLLVNGGLQTKDLTGWSQSTEGTASVIFDNSQNFLTSSVRSQYYGAKLKASDKIEQVITGLTPNTKYTVSAWMKTSNALGSIVIGARNYGGDPVEKIVNSTNWTQQTFDITTGPTDTSAVVYVQNKAVNTPPEYGSYQYELARIPLSLRYSWYSANVTQFVKNEYTGDKKASFILTSDTAFGDITMYDRTHAAYKPKLEINTVSGAVYTINSSEDCYVENTAAGGGAAHNASPIQVSGIASKTKHGYLKFDLSNIHQSEEISSVSLNVYTNWVDQRGGVTLTVNSLPDDSWQETTLTWNNKPIIQTASAAPVNDGFADDISLSLPIMYNTSKDSFIAALMDAQSALDSACNLCPIHVKDSFNSLILFSKEVLKNTSATDEEINSTLTALLDSTNVFKARNILGNEVEKTEAFSSEQVEGTDFYQYPIGSKAVLQEKIQAAKTALSDLSVSIEAINNEKLAVEQALLNFKNNLIKPDIFSLKIADMDKVLYDTGNTKFSYYNGSTAFKQDGYTVFSADVSRYIGDSQDTEAFKFDMTYDFAKPNGYPGFLLRSQSSTGRFNTASTYFIIFKQTTWELQKYQNGVLTSLTSFPNVALTQPNKKYTVAIGSTNTPVGVRAFVYVDGVPAFDVIDKDNPISTPGYFGIVSSGTNTSDIMIKPCELGTRISGSNTVNKGKDLNVVVGLKDVSGAVYAQDLTVAFVPEVFSFKGAASQKEGTVILETYKSQPGLVRFVLANLGADAITNDEPVMEITFNANEYTDASSISVIEHIVSDENGNEIQTEGASMMVQVSDLDSLREAIALAQNLYNQAEEGYIAGQYIRNSKAALLEGIAAAQVVAENPSVAYEQINQALADLNQRIIKFSSRKITESTADVNKDGKVSIGDMGFLAARYDWTTGHAQWQDAKIADFDEDGKIDIYDLALVAKLIIR